MIDNNVAQPKGFRSLQVRIVFLTYLSYFTYYFGRKYFGVITPTLIEEDVLSKIQIGFIQTGYLSLYAVGQFVSGALGDKYGPRLLIFGGMLVSGLASLAIGLFPFFGIVFVAFSLNGLAQSTGWPNNCKLISSWVPHTYRGRVMGFWMTCYVSGSLAANTLAGYLIGEEYSWKYIVFVNGMFVIIIGVIQGLLILNRPEDAGYSIPRRTSTVGNENRDRSSFIKMVTHPVILVYGSAYFALKFIRYTVFSWFPLYLVEAKDFAKNDAAYASSGFEIGGFIGLILGGLLADKFFKNNKGRLAWFALMGVAVAAFFFKDLSGGGFWVVIGALSLVGFFVYIADSILSGTAAQDVGGVENSASATGIINGIGSVGGALSGIVPIWIQQEYGWNAVFLVFAFFSIVAVVLLAPVALKKEIKKF